MAKLTNAARTIDWNEIDWSDAALSCLDWASTGTRGIVRPTSKGDFALIELDGAARRLVKRFPTLDQARAYNFACAR